MLRTTNISEMPDSLNTSNIRNTLIQSKQANQINQIQIAKRKKQEILNLFKTQQPIQFNLKILHKSQLMTKNQLFAYLVKCLNKQRHGMFYSLQDQCHPNPPSKLQGKIKQFLYNSLQEATLVPQSQLIKTKYLQRLFMWFTNVFKERQLQMGFKRQKSNKQNENGQIFDQDWFIRNNYKSNMPLELSTYQRKIITLNPTLQKNNIQINTQQQQIKGQQKHSSTHYQKKLYQKNCLKQNTRHYQKLLPILTQKSFYAQTSKIRQNRQDNQFEHFKSQWQKKKAHFGQESAKNFYKQKFDHDKLFKKDQLRKNPFKRLQKINISSNLGNFKSVQNNQKINNQFQFFHPYLTGNNFNDIKMKKIQKLKGQRMNLSKTMEVFQFKPKIAEENSQQQNQDILQTHQTQQKQQINLCSNSKIFAVNIDGIGLFANPFDKSAKNKKSK